MDQDSDSTSSEPKRKPAAFLTDAAFLSVSAVAWSLLAGIVQVDGVSGDLGVAIALIVGHALFVLTISPWEDVVKSGGTTTEAMWLGSINLVVLVLLLISPLMSFSAGGPDWMTSATLAAVILTVLYLFATFFLNLYFTLTYPTEMGTAVPVTASAIMERYLKSWTGMSNEESTSLKNATLGAVPVKKYKKTADATSLNRTWMTTNRVTTSVAKAAILVCLFITPAWSLEMVEKVAVLRASSECMADTAPIDYQGVRPRRMCVVGGQICKDVDIGSDDYDILRQAASANKLCGINGANTFMMPRGTVAGFECATLSTFVSACITSSRNALGQTSVPVIKTFPTTLTQLPNCEATTACKYFNLFTEERYYSSRDEYVAVGQKAIWTDIDSYTSSGFPATVSVMTSKPDNYKSDALFAVVGSKAYNVHKRSDDFHCSNPLVQFGSTNEPMCLGLGGAGWKNDPDASYVTMKSTVSEGGYSPVAHAEQAIWANSLGNATLAMEAEATFRTALWYALNVDVNERPPVIVTSNLAIALANAALSCLCNDLVAVGAASPKLPAQWLTVKSNLKCTRAAAAGFGTTSPSDVFQLKSAVAASPWISVTTLADRPPTYTCA